MTADQTDRLFKEMVATLNQPTPTPAPAVEQLPPGTAWGYTAAGQRVPVYLDPPTPTEPTPTAQPIPAWAKTTALLTFSTSAGIGIASMCLAYAADSLESIARGLAALAVIVSCIAAAVMVVAACFKRDRGPRQVTHITQHVTATGWFGRANGGHITKQ